MFPPPEQLDHVQQSLDRERARLLRSLISHAGAVTLFGWLYVVLGVLGGAGLALYPERDALDVTAHPYIGLGVAVALGSLVVGLVVVMLAAWARAWAVSQR